MNVRVPVLIACTLALGVLTGYVLSYYQYDAYWLIAVVPVTAIIFILCTIFRKKKLQIFTLIFAAAFSCGATYCFFTVEKLKVCDVNTENLYNITGTVTEKGASAYGEYIILKTQRPTEPASRESDCLPAGGLRRVLRHGGVRRAAGH